MSRVSVIVPCYNYARFLLEELLPHVARIASNHQGLENRLIAPTLVQVDDGPVHRRARLGGTLNFYYRKAA